MNVESFYKSWRIKGTDKPSKIYRYLEQDYIDLFFKEGILKLSSFESNRNKEGDIRQDINEGFHYYRLVSRNRLDMIELEMRDFDARRLLCCSTQLDLNHFLPYFNVNGCFEITNSLGFGYEIAKVLSGFKFGQEGKVVYNDNKTTYLFMEHYKELPDIYSEMSNQELYPHLDKIGKISITDLFRKHTRYSAEDEYRLVWQCDYNHDLFIKCPNAIRFCKKIT